MLCDVVRGALTGFEVCEDTLDGARVPTHCLYPSFENVHVYIVKIGDGYRIHDGAGAYRTAWAHGRDHAAIMRIVAHEADRFHLKCDGEAITSPEVDAEWLASAILSVANASSIAANRVVAKMQKAHEDALVEKIDRALDIRFDKSHVAREYIVTGKSGGERIFDFGILDGDRISFLINGVVPHHASINAKYVAFSDLDLEQDRKLAVFDKELATEDVALLKQVSSIVPFSALGHVSSRKTPVPAG